MAAESGRTDHNLKERLLLEPYRFDFFQAVRLLERIYPERQPVGRADAAPHDEVVRFRTRPTLAFPPSQVYSITPPAANGHAAHEGEKMKQSPGEMTVAFMGLTGPLGVLPHFYTELLAERKRSKDSVLWEFLDLFNHRLISFFYRAWEKYRFPVSYERDRSDAFTEYLFNLVGMGGREIRGNNKYLPREIFIYYGGLIAQRPHSASAVEAILSDYFKVEARVRQFAGQWLKLEEEDLTRLGSANHALGLTTIVGRRVWDDQSKFRLRLGPMSLEEFKGFLPSGKLFKTLAALVRFLVGEEFDFDVQLLLDAKELPFCRLTSEVDEQPRLGWTSWLKSGVCSIAHDEQVVFAVEAEL